MGPPSSTIAWLAANPPPDSAFGQSLAGVARRALAGESFELAVRELLDELAVLQTREQRERAIAEQPPLRGDPRHDAYLAALGEHFAVRFDIDRPQWVTGAERFLDHFWFKSAVTRVQGDRDRAIAGRLQTARHLHRRGRTRALLR